MKRIFEINSDIIWRKINDEAVLLNSKNGKYFGLNSVGCSMLKKIDGKKDLEEIVKMLADEYEVDGNILKADIEELVNKMKDNDILKVINK